MALGVFALCSCRPGLDPLAPQDPPLVFAYAGTVPGAAAQPTPLGKAILDLTAWQDRLYVGYGDYGANTGPIAITTFSPSTGVIAEVYKADTEAVWNYRPMGDELVAPSIDPRIASDAAVAEVGEPWRAITSIGATHVFDGVALGSDWYLAGSRDVNAEIWRSSDQGLTWAMVLSLAPAGDGSFLRFFWIASLDGRLYAQAYVCWDPPKRGWAQPAAWELVDGVWRERPGILVPGGGWGWKPYTVAGRVVFHGWGHDRTGSLFSFDGTRTIEIAAKVRDHTVDSEGRLWIVTADRRVMVSSDLATWDERSSGIGGPQSPTAIGLLGDTVVLADADARLWTSLQPSPRHE